MNQNKPISVFDKLSFPRKPNYEYTSEYFASKASDPGRHIGRFNTGDNIERNVEITNYLVRRQLTKTNKKLENKRTDYNDKRKKVQEQWDDLKQKESSLRKNFIRFNQFVKENQEKTERATNKIIEQNQLKEERQRRMDELAKKTEDISATKAKMDKKIAQYRIYEDFLLRVIEREESMQSINDLLKRYEALISARKELNDIQQRDMMKLEKAKSNLSRLTYDYSTKITTFKNHVILLQDRYKMARAQSDRWEKVHRLIKCDASKKMVDIMAIKESCRKMYLEVCARKQLKPTHLTNVEKQLLVIKQAIGEYEIINRRIKELQEAVVKESVEPRASTSTV